MARGLLGQAQTPVYLFGIAPGVNQPVIGLNGQFNLVIPAGLDETVEFNNSPGFVAMAFHIIPPTNGTVRFESTFDGINWDGATGREIGADGYTQLSDGEESFYLSIAGARKVRFRTTIAGSADGSVAGQAFSFPVTIEGIEHGSAPHAIGHAPVYRDFSFTTQQTNTDLWIPEASHRFVITDINYSTIDAGIITFFDQTNATGNIIHQIQTVPPTGVGQFVPVRFVMPYVSDAIDNRVRLTTSAAMTIRGVISGYEIFG